MPKRDNKTKVRHVGTGRFPVSSPGTVMTREERAAPPRLNTPGVGR